MIDFIGDIHGYADRLEQLLQKLGYVKGDKGYSHRERRVLFVGDYIDRGPQIKETLHLVKSMVDAGNAIALMGNHEYNAICFHFQESEGGHLCKHSIKNMVQHYETIRQFQNLQTEYEAYIDWFKTLPLFYETENFRAVHACWDQKNIEYLKSELVNNRLTDELIYQSVKKGAPLYAAIDQTLKGKEVSLPEGCGFKDKDGAERSEIRIKWWENPMNMNYRSISVEPLNDLPETPVVIDAPDSDTYYREDEKPVFFGHYWLKGDPLLYRSNVCCLDYSVAKGGKLVAYRFNGEPNLQSHNLIYV